MNSHIYAFFNTLYKYFQVSFYFWLFLLKGSIIYSLIPSFTALLLTIKELHNEGADEENHVKDIFTKHFNLFNQYKFVSFVFSIIVITSFSSLYLLNRSTSPYALMLTILVIYTLVMTVLLFTYTIFYLMNQHVEIRQMIMISFVSMIRNFAKSIMVLIFIIVLLILAYYNFLLFIIVGPFLYAISVNGTLRSLATEK